MELLKQGKYYARDAGLISVVFFVDDLNALHSFIRNLFEIPRTQHNQIEGAVSFILRTLRGSGILLDFSTIIWTAR